jgi:hypothetical protein
VISGSTRQETFSGVMQVRPWRIKDVKAVGAWLSLHIVWNKLFAMTANIMDY